MDLLDHSKMNAGQLSTARSYAKLLGAITVEMNQVLRKHGLTDLRIDSFAFKKHVGEANYVGEAQPPMGIGVTAGGVWVAQS